MYFFVHFFYYCSTLYTTLLFSCIIHFRDFDALVSPPLTALHLTTTASLTQQPLNNQFCDIDNHWYAFNDKHMTKPIYPRSCQVRFMLRCACEYGSSVNAGLSQLDPLLLNFCQRSTVHRCLPLRQGMAWRHGVGVTVVLVRTWKEVREGHTLTGRARYRD